MNRFVILSGCSGGGKSTLLAELARRGHAVIEEPGRRIVEEQSRTGGDALPWLDMAAFLRRATDMARDDYSRALQSQAPYVFFDRCPIDTAAALAALTGEPVLAAFRNTYRYHTRVFLVPPWPELYARDEARRHGFEAALREFERLECVYPAMGYELTVLARTDVASRADFVLQTLAQSHPVIPRPMDTPWPEA